MALEFKVYEQTSTLENLGTLSALAGVKGKLAFINGNLNHPTKRVAVVMLNSKGESTTVTCSASVSASVRQGIKAGVTHEQALSALSELSVLEREDGAHYLAPEGSGSLNFFAVADIVKKSTKLTYADLLESIV